MRQNDNDKNGFYCPECGEWERGTGETTDGLCFNCYQYLQYEYSMMENE